MSRLLPWGKTLPEGGAGGGGGWVTEEGFAWQSEAARRLVGAGGATGPRG